MMSTRDEIISATFSALDQHLRKASIAQIGGFRPPTDPLTSWFGGHFLALPNESWPENERGPMIPLLQIRIDELPFVPSQLKGIAFLTVYIDSKELPVGSATNGDHFQIRTYPTLENLIPGTCPTEHWVRPFPIQWSLSENDAPEWEDAGRCFHPEFNALEDSVDLFYDRYDLHRSTKVGGWPSYIQGGGYDASRFVFQIGTEAKSNWMWGDNGNAYFYLDDDDEWLMLWDCY